MRRSLALCFAILFVGCTNETSPKKSPKVQAFKEKVAIFLEEARAAAKLITNTPSLKAATDKVAQIEDLYAHIPDVPKEIDETGHVAILLKNINSVVKTGASFVPMRIEFQSLGLNEDEIDKGVREIAAGINSCADEIEERLSQ